MRIIKINNGKVLLKAERRPGPSAPDRCKPWNASRGARSITKQRWLKKRGIHGTTWIAYQSAAKLEAKIRTKARWRSFDASRWFQRSQDRFLGRDTRFSHRCISEYGRVASWSKLKWVSASYRDGNLDFAYKTSLLWGKRLPGPGWHRDTPKLRE